MSECGKTEGPIKLSFDFNVDPFTVLVYQDFGPDGLKFFDKIKLPSSDIYQVCDWIKANYPNDFYIVTGDRTGWNRSGHVKGKTSYWKIIKTELKLSDPQIRLRGKNLDLIESRVLCNSALKFKNIVIDPELKEFITECQYATVDEAGILIKDRKKNKNDFFDCGRYAMDSKWPNLTRRPK